jgi:hypothetical protein
MMQLPNHPLFEKLERLSFPQGDWAIFGSDPLWHRGIRESNDMTSSHAEQLGNGRRGMWKR